MTTSITQDKIFYVQVKLKTREFYTHSSTWVKTLADDCFFSDDCDLLAVSDKSILAVPVSLGCKPDVDTAKLLLMTLFTGDPYYTGEEPEPKYSDEYT